MNHILMFYVHRRSSFVSTDVDPGTLEYGRCLERAMQYASDMVQLRLTADLLLCQFVVQHLEMFLKLNTML